MQRRSAAQAPLPLAPDSKKPLAEASAEASEPVPQYLSRLGPVSGGRELPGAFQNQLDAPLCHECGHIMVRNGSCFRCFNCGATSGCS